MPHVYGTVVIKKYQDLAPGHGTRDIPTNCLLKSVVKSLKEPPFLLFTEDMAANSLELAEDVAANSLELVKLVNGTRIFIGKVSNGKTGLPFQTVLLLPEISTATTRKVVFHLLSNRNFRNLLVNGKRP